MSDVDESVVRKKEQLEYSNRVGNRLEIERATGSNAGHYSKYLSSHSFGPNKTLNAKDGSRLSILRAADENTNENNSREQISITEVVESTKMVEEEPFVGVNDKIANEKLHCESEKASFEQICTAFQWTSHTLSKVNCNSVLSVLRSNAEHVDHFLSQMHIMVSIKQYIDSTQDEKI